jgi:diacylglycerol O-acyltransferase 2, plant
LSASIAREIFPDDIFCGVGADIVFYFPIYRHIMAWVGTFPASRQNITKILDSGCCCTVLPGGIAEMYVFNEQEEGIYLKKRRNTVKAALQEGAHIVPAYFFGNSRLFSPMGTESGNESFLSRISRKLRASIVFYTGRHYLPVPFRHPLKMVVGAPVLVEGGPNPNPSEKQIDDLLDRVVQAVQELYDQNKPEWETRPLVVH